MSENCGCPGRGGQPAYQRSACPKCGRPGKGVPPTTIRAHAITPPDPADGFAFCETPDCPVVYYGPQIIPTTGVRTRVGVKVTEHPKPVCYCFSFTEQDIIGDVLACGRCTIRDFIVEKVRLGECACEIKNPSGRCCLGNVGQAARKAAQAGVGVGARREGHT